MDAGLFNLSEQKTKRVSATFLSKNLSKNLYFLKHVLWHAALGAHPVLRQGFEGGAWLNAVVGVSLLRIVDVAANGALPFDQGVSTFAFILNGP